MRHAFEDLPPLPQAEDDRLEEIRRAGTRPAAQDTDSSSDAQAEVRRLAGLSAAEYESERKGAALRLAWRTSVLDAEVSKARPHNLVHGEDDGTQEFIETVEPWPDPVDGVSLAAEIRDRLKAHVVFGAAGDADAATLWIIGSYLMDTWRLWPRLLVTSPTKACGKSTLLEVIDAMAHRGFIVSNASAAAIFRAIEAWRPTLLLDEADTWMKENVELAGVLNSGHTRRTARVIRVQEVNGEQQPVAFSTWCSMVIAGIGSQRDTLESRSIKISLRRKLPEETVQRMPVDLNDQLLNLRRQLARWADDNAVALGAMDIEPQDAGDDRLRDNFTPLWCIAAALGGPWPARIEAAYIATAQENEDHAEPSGVMMLRDIDELFAARGVNRIATSEMVSELVDMEERPWGEWRHGRPITAQSVAKHLKAFGVRAKVLKLNGVATRVYVRGEVEAAAARYVAPKRNAVTLQQNQLDSTSPTRNLEAEVTPEDPDNSLKKREGYGVTPEKAESGGCVGSDDPHDPDAWV